MRLRRRSIFILGASEIYKWLRIYMLRQVQLLACRRLAEASGRSEFEPARILFVQLCSAQAKLTIAPVGPKTNGQSCKQTLALWWPLECQKGGWQNSISLEAKRPQKCERQCCISAALSERGAPDALGSALF